MFTQFFRPVSNYHNESKAQRAVIILTSNLQVTLEHSVTATIPANPQIDSGISVLKVKGYLDMTTAEQLGKAIASVYRQNKYKVIIDLENVEYISSMGWSVILSKIKDFRTSGGDIKLMNMPPNVFEVYRLLEFDLFLDAYDNIDDVILSFKKNNHAY